MATDMMQDMDFEKMIAEFPSETKFLARQLKEVKENCAVCNENRVSKKQTFSLGSVGGVVGGFIGGIIQGMITKGNVS